MNRNAHVFSAISLVFMLALAAGSKAPTAAELEAGAAKDTADKKTLDDYIVKMGAAYTMLAALDPSKLRDSRCDQAAMLTKAPPGKDDHGALKLQRIYGPYMARFASKNQADWTKYDGDWAWLTDSSYGGHFETFPALRDNYALVDTARRVKEEFIPSRYAIIVWPTNAKNRMPVWHEAKHTFDSGIFAGIVYVVDVIDKSVTCQAHLVIESSDEVSFRTRGLLRTKGEVAVKDDFENKMKEALQTALPVKIDFGTMGTIF